MCKYFLTEEMKIKGKNSQRNIVTISKYAKKSLKIVGILEKRMS